MGGGQSSPEKSGPHASPEDGLRALSLAALKNRAIAFGVVPLKLDAAIARGDPNDHKGTILALIALQERMGKEPSAAITALLGHLELRTVPQLRKRAARSGNRNLQIVAADESTDPKSALIALILSKEAPGSAWSVGAGWTRFELTENIEAKHQTVCENLETIGGKEGELKAREIKESIAFLGTNKYRKEVAFKFAEFGGGKPLAFDKLEPSLSVRNFPLAKAVCRGTYMYGADAWRHLPEMNKIMAQEIFNEFDDENGTVGEEPFSMLSKSLVMCAALEKSVMVAEELGVNGYEAV
jgi:hypothetical protein